MSQINNRDFSICSCNYFISVERCDLAFYSNEVPWPAEHSTLTITLLYRRASGCLFQITDTHCCHFFFQSVRALNVVYNSIRPIFFFLSFFSLTHSDIITGSMPSLATCCLACSRKVMVVHVSVSEWCSSGH